MLTSFREVIGSHEFKEVLGAKVLGGFEYKRSLLLEKIIILFLH